MTRKKEFEEYSVHQRRNIYLVNEDLDHTWDEAEILEFERLWRVGVSVYCMAGLFDRDVDEVALLVMDRSRKKAISKRPGGFKGNGKEYKGYLPDEQKAIECTEENFNQLLKEGHSVIKIAELMDMTASNLHIHKRKWKKERVNVG